MGGSIGPALADELIGHYGDNIAIQGVKYPATLIGNTLPFGSDPKGPAELKRLLKDAVSKCPTSKIVVSGYSQGGAVVHTAFRFLHKSVLSRVNVVVTFGDTRKKQDGNSVPNYPVDKTLFICNEGDKICDGTLIVEEPHLHYEPRAPEAAEFTYAHVG